MKNVKPIRVTSKSLHKGRGTYIGRASDPKFAVFGNPYSHKDGTLAQFKVDTLEESVLKYRRYMYDRYLTDEYFRLAINSLVRMYLAGEEIILVCWCKTKENPDALCHGDVIKEFVEQLALIGL